MPQQSSLRHFPRCMSRFQLGLARLGVAVSSVCSLVDCAASRPIVKAANPSACEMVPPRLGITASQHINAPPGQPGLPVQVRVYQLKSADRFDNTSFEDVWTQGATVFGEALLDAQEYSVYPSEQRQWTAAVLPEARTLAFVALFREPHGSDWFVAYDVQSPHEQPPCVGEVQFSVWLDGMRMRAGVGPGEATHINRERRE